MQLHQSNIRKLSEIIDWGTDVITNREFRNYYQCTLYSSWGHTWNLVQLFFWCGWTKHINLSMQEISFETLSCSKLFGLCQEDCADSIVMQSRCVDVSSISNWILHHSLIVFLKHIGWGNMSLYTNWCIASSFQIVFCNYLCSAGADISLAFGPIILKLWNDNNSYTKIWKRVFFCFSKFSLSKTQKRCLRFFSKSLRFLCQHFR